MFKEKFRKVKFKCFFNSVIKSMALKSSDSICTYKNVSIEMVFEWKKYKIKPSIIVEIILSNIE
ncbi:hypothetical protein JCM31826_15420 [Thermaurantimonas aggregans]|uniref:Uncharacterized protein n=1 Tax=Thermaurantimonas aggregans TaxID=2173829 RepID=A0A401XM23_9FLAO|nr:hypothetical protein JCM31826_15420 [Thermaurantimonas aggregans]